MKYPGSPGYKQSATSREAAALMEPRACTIRAAVLAALTTPHTADEMAARLGLPILSVRPRFSELHRDGCIEPTGRRATAGRISHTIWRRVENYEQREMSL